jgi:hypothetical protein
MALSFHFLLMRANPGADRLSTMLFDVGMVGVVVYVYVLLPRGLSRLRRRLGIVDMILDVELSGTLAVPVVKSESLGLVRWLGLGQFAVLSVKSCVDCLGLIAPCCVRQSASGSGCGLDCDCLSS